MTTTGKITLPNVIIGVILALLIGSFLVPTAHHMGDVATTAKCAAVLHQIGLALQIYEDANHGQFPRTLGDGSDDPKPTWGTPYQIYPALGPVAGANPFKHQDTTPDANDVTASLFLLARNTDLPYYAFVCPDSTQQYWDFGGNGHTANDWTNWQGNAGLLAHLSYSFQNLFISQKAIDAGFLPLTLHEPTFALAADMNPGTSVVTTVNLHSTVAELKTANSPNHHYRGQNVLFGDRHVEWMENPLCGTLHDNIYTSGGPETEGTPFKSTALNTSPTGPDDSVLLPTAADLTPPKSNPPKGHSFWTRLGFK